MPQVLVNVGDIIPVAVKLEFEGTVRNHSILVEKQFIPTINNERKNFPIKLDGDPIQIKGNFIGVKNSVIKKIEIEINGETGFKLSDIIFKNDEIEINLPVPYSKFKLVQNVPV